ncbi:conserved hypothetical protein [Gammaproteobacteria bacterium]
MEQILLHLFGDYFLQTDKQALNKKKSSYHCLLHCLSYSLIFLFIASWKAVVVIGVTHFIIDRWSVVPYLIAIKNQTKKEVIDKKSYKGKGSYPIKMVYDISNFGFAIDRPFVLSIWLMIITDNTFHLIINYFAIKWF